MKLPVLMTARKKPGGGLIKDSHHSQTQNYTACTCYV
jgi:hypothetical protein